MPAARPDPERLFQPVASRSHLALAVSGGSDSMALLRLAAEWREKPNLTVLTVDHGLRPEAAQEGRQVAEWSAQAGLAHVTLEWNAARPQTGIQAKAREARYNLMSEWCRRNDAATLLTAHTLDDQAETVVMRLARTASLDSLAGIYCFNQWNRTELFRPLLGERRQTLRAHLKSLGQAWIEDPSNEDERFERVRIRKAMPALHDIGITTEGLAELARRARGAVQGLWGATENWVRLHVREFDTGYCVIPLEAFSDQTEELKTRILGWLISRFGAGKMSEPAELELLAAWVDVGGSRRTLGGAIVARRKNHLLIGREPNRIDPAPLSVPNTGRVIWDRRFEIQTEAGNRVIPVLCAGSLRRDENLPWFVQAGLPAIVGKDQALSVPHLGVGSGAKAIYQPRLVR